MSDKDLFFSIIIPVYNRERKIKKAIDSVLDQKFDKWELIVVDDDSSDNTINIVNSFQDSRITCISTNRNSGPAYARNLGINHASGNVICFLDSDDRYDPSFLAETYNCLINSDSNVGFSWTGLRVRYKKGERNELWNPSIMHSIYHTFLTDLRIGTNSGLSVKKSVFDTCGMFNDKLKAAEDTEFLYRIVQSFGFKVVEKPLVFIDKSGSDRLSMDYSKIALAYNTFIPWHWTYIKGHPKLMDKFTYKLMWLNYHLGDKKTARSFFNFRKSDGGFSLKSIVVAFLFEVLGNSGGRRLHLFFSK